MCGRYNLTKDPANWPLGQPIVSQRQAPFSARYNIAPGQQVPVLRDTGGEELELIDMTWGFVPHFITDEKPRVKPINARAETAADKPLFREAIRNHRCLVPATGFYEWQRTDGRKQPYHIHLPRQRPFLMAGIWDYQGGDEARPTLAILTTEAQGRVRPIHDRMPLVIPSEAIDSWLDGSTPPLTPEDTPFETDRIRTRVNNVAHDDPEVLTPSRPGPAEAR